MKAKTYNTIFFIHGLLTLLYMVYKIGLQVIWNNIVQTGIWFVPVIGIWLIIYILNALAFKEIIFERKLPESNLPFLSILKLTISGYAINYITPFIALGGEPYRVMTLQKKLNTNKATSSVLLYNIIHIFSHIIFWMVSIICIIIVLKPGLMALLGCILTFLIFFFLLYWVFLKYKKGLLMITFTMLSKIPFLRKKIGVFIEKRRENLLEIDQHIIDLFSHRSGTFYASMVFEFVARAIGCLEIYFIALALQAPIGLFDSFVISAGSSLFANLIFFSPMQLGAREGGFILALRSMGLNGGMGIFMSLVTRIRELVWIFIGLILMKTKSKHL